MLFFFFFNDTATTEIYTLSLHDALPIYTNGLDEAYAIPSELALKLALRTQQIIADETRVTSVVDPLGDRKSTRLNSSHSQISYVVFYLKNKNALMPAVSPARFSICVRAI